MTTPRSSVDRAIDYPTSDGRPMGETEVHINDLMDLLQTLRAHFAADPLVYVGGNMLVFYEPGNKRKHISPDVFLVRGVPKRESDPRDYYLLWEEGRGPDVVIELTSQSTRREDQKKKRDLYRDVLRVPEYFLFDPKEEYLRPSMQGYELRGGVYEPIAAVAGRLPSVGLGLHLERVGTELRLFDPATGRRLPTPLERAAEAEAARLHAEAARLRAEAAEHRAEAAEHRAEAAERHAEAAQLLAETENERLRQELEVLRRRLSEPT